MLVREGYDILRRLIKEGHGDLPLVGTDSRSGDSNEAHIGGVAEVQDGDNAGILCVWDKGTKYVSVYLD